MPSSYTTSLRLTLPATGELAGQWGSTVNTGITELLDAAVAGTTVISTWGGAGVPYTLSNNSGTADEARKMFLVATGAPGEAKNVICPAVSKLYVFRNDTTGGFALTLKTSGGTGIAVPAGQYKMLYCDGTNVVEAVNSPGPVASLSASQAVFTDGSKNLVSNAVTGTGNVVMSASPTLTGTVAGASLQLSSLTSGRVTYAGASGLLQDSTNLTFDGTSLTLGGNPTLSAGAANGVLYLNGSKVATSGSALTFDGTTFKASRAGTPFILAENTASAAAAVVQVKNTAGSTYLGQDSTGGYLLTDYAAPLLFYINNTEQMRLTSTGLGIGTSSPATLLDLRTSNGVSAILRLGSSSSVGNTTVGTIEFYDADADDAGIKSSISNVITGNVGPGGSQGGNLLFSTATSGATPTERMRLDSSGNLGLGVTPSAWATANGQKALQIAGVTSISQQGNGSANVMCNAYESAANAFSYVVSAGAMRYNQSASDGHAWFISTGVPSAGSPISFTQAMTLDASGNLTLGQTSSALQSGGTGITLYGSSASELKFLNSTTGQAATDGTALVTSGSDFVINNREAGAITFGTSNTERARITSGGEFVIGATAAVSSEKLYVNGSNTEYLVRWYNTNASPKGLVMSYTGAAPNGTGNAFLRCDDTGALRAEFRSNGGLANYSANDVNLSDRREKTNFAPAKPYLDTICAIPVQTFNYIDQSEDDPGLTLGVVAQDVQTVAPELVMESNWGTAEDPKMRLSIYQTDLQYALMKCIQELKAQNDELRARVAALEAQP